MDLGLEGRKIVVAGGSLGLGFALASRLAAEGADLLLCSRSRENLERTASALERPPGSRPLLEAADLSQEGSAERLAKRAEECWGRVDGLVINSGGPPLGSALAHDDATWRRAFEGLVLGPVRLARAFVPGMAARGYGRILCIASTGVKQPIPNLVLSNSLRLAVIGFLKTLALESAAKGVLVNTLLPGPTRTERLDRIHAGAALASGKSLAEIEAERLREIPAGRFGEPGELAALGAFLLAPVNSYCTGQAIAVDGGRTLFPL